MTKFRTLILASALAAVASPAFAGDFFARGEVGTTRAEFSYGSASDSDNDTAYAVRGGYMGKYFGVEGFYGQYYDASFDGADLKADGYGFALVGKYRFGEDKGFFIDGRLGLARTTLKASVDFVPAPPSPETVTGPAKAGPAPIALSGEYTHTQPYAGVGVGYDFNEHYGVTLNYTHQNKLKPAPISSPAVELNTLALGFEYRF